MTVPYDINVTVYSIRLNFLFLETTSKKIHEISDLNALEINEAGSEPNLRFLNIYIDTELL